MSQRLDALIDEQAQLDSGARDDEIQKRLHALSSSIGRLKSKLGTLATKPASESANRIDWINVELRRIEASDPIKSQRQSEAYLTSSLASLNAYRDSAQKVVDEYSEAAVDTKRQKVAETEEQLRQHGFPVALFQAERISAFDVVKVLKIGLEQSVTPRRTVGGARQGQYRFRQSLRRCFFCLCTASVARGRQPGAIFPLYYHRTKR